MDESEWEKSAVYVLTKILEKNKKKIISSGLSFETGKEGVDYTKNKIYVNTYFQYVLVEKCKSRDMIGIPEEYSSKDLAKRIIKEKLKTTDEIKRFVKELKEKTGKNLEEEVEKYSTN